MKHERLIDLRGPLQGTLTIPGCKSFTNRALLCAALAPGTSTLVDASHCGDSRRMAEMLRLAEVSIEHIPRGYRVEGIGKPPVFHCDRFDVGDSGTVMRFLLPYLASGDGEGYIDGSPQMRKRPIGPLVDALRGLGASLDYLGNSGFPPVRLRAKGLRGGKVSISGELSSQFLSGLLLSAPAFQGKAIFRPTGIQRSKPYLDMTLQVQRAFGVAVDGEYEIREGSFYRARRFSVPGDSSAAFAFVAAVILGGGEITLKNLPDDPLINKLSGLFLADELGFQYERKKDGVVVRSGRLRPVTVDLGDTPDLVPTLAVLALFAKGKSMIRGVPHLRIKESNRLHTISIELKKCGAAIEETEEGLLIEGGRKLHGAVLDSHGDHRLAICFSILGIRVPGIVVRGLEAVSKSFPDFFSCLERLFDKRATRSKKPR